MQSCVATITIKMMSTETVFYCLLKSKIVTPEFLKQLLRGSDIDINYSVVRHRARLYSSWWDVCAQTPALLLLSSLLLLFLFHKTLTLQPER